MKHPHIYIAAALLLFAGCSAVGVGDNSVEGGESANSTTPHVTEWNITEVHEANTYALFEYSITVAPEGSYRIYGQTHRGRPLDISFSDSASGTLCIPKIRDRNVQLKVYVLGEGTHAFVKWHRIIDARAMPDDSDQAPC